MFRVSIKLYGSRFRRAKADRISKAMPRNERQGAIPVHKREDLRRVYQDAFRDVLDTKQCLSKGGSPR
ncbi:hypothetical protein GCM10022404_08550 [Celeribacter arenosi]|uniref:Uncharacterized protein n=1 Tax=Celeribacter arenosi TaxID=792649 RepID=A0ABP7K027_9RHOB